MNMDALLQCGLTFGLCRDSLHSLWRWRDHDPDSSIPHIDSARRFASCTSRSGQRLEMGKRLHMWGFCMMDLEVGG